MPTLTLTQAQFDTLRAMAHLYIGFTTGTTHPDLLEQRADQLEVVHLLDRVPADEAVVAPPPTAVRIVRLAVAEDADRVELLRRAGKVTAFTQAIQDSDKIAAIRVLRDAGDAGGLATQKPFVEAVMRKAWA